MNLRTAISELVSIVVWGVVIFAALWSVGAAFGVMAIGYCAIAVCR